MVKKLPGSLLKSVSLALFSMYMILSGCEKEDEKENIIVTDIDGNIYHTVTLGRQVWMVENLRVTTFNDGTLIPYITSGEDWEALNTGAYCIYDNDETNSDILGNLYNWHAVSSGKLAPEGWHVPDMNEWLTLISYLKRNGYGISGNTDAIGKSMADNSGWTEFKSPFPETDKFLVGNEQSNNNASGLTMIPAGCRNQGTYEDLGSEAYFWTSTEYNIERAIGKNLGNYSITLASLITWKNEGYSVRCIKD